MTTIDELIDRCEESLILLKKKKYESFVKKDDYEILNNYIDENGKINESFENLLNDEKIKITNLILNACENFDKVSDEIKIKIIRKNEYDINNLILKLKNNFLIIDDDLKNIIKLKSSECPSIDINKSINNCLDILKYQRTRTLFKLIDKIKDKISPLIEREIIQIAINVPYPSDEYYITWVEYFKIIHSENYDLVLLNPKLFIFVDKPNDDLIHNYVKLMKLDNNCNFFNEISQNYEHNAFYYEWHVTPPHNRQISRNNEDSELFENFQKIVFIYFPDFEFDS